MAKNLMELKGFDEGFKSLIAKLESVNGNVKSAVEDAMGQLAETVEWDTKDAMSTANLPAQGAYSQGETMRSIIEDAQVRWEGSVGWIPLGFDFSQTGAGGFLITGTPRMRPNYELQRIYKQRKYMKAVEKDLSEVIMDYVIGAMEGRR